MSHCVSNVQNVGITDLCIICLQLAIFIVDNIGKI